jgi:hypothetical protein
MICGVLSNAASMIRSSLISYLNTFLRYFQIMHKNEIEIRLTNKKNVTHMGAKHQGGSWKKYFGATIRICFLFNVFRFLLVFQCFFQVYKMKHIIPPPLPIPRLWRKLTKWHVFYFR